MDNGIYNTESFDVDYATFGGKVYYSDFLIGTESKYHTLADIAARIAMDWEFDKKCEKNGVQRHINEHARAVSKYADECNELYERFAE